MLNSFSIIEIESVEIDFLKIEIAPYSLDFSTLLARTTLFLQQSKLFFSNNQNYSSPTNPSKP